VTLSPTRGRRDQLCIGLADSEIQEDLLKDPNQDMSVEEMIRFIEV
jgi:hypothetical protein